MQCQACKSDRILSFSGKVDDCFSCAADNSVDKIDYDGYVPYDLNLGGGDYLDGEVCLSCGHLQGDWPVPPNISETIHDGD